MENDLINKINSVSNKDQSLFVKKYSFTKQFRLRIESGFTPDEAAEAIYSNINELIKSELPEETKFTILRMECDELSRPVNSSLIQQLKWELRNSLTRNEKMKLSHQQIPESQNLQAQQSNNIRNQNERAIGIPVQSIDVVSKPEVSVKQPKKAAKKIINPNNSDKISTPDSAKKIKARSNKETSDKSTPKITPQPNQYQNRSLNQHLSQIINQQPNQQSHIRNLQVSLNESNETNKSKYIDQKSMEYVVNKFGNTRPATNEFIIKNSDLPPNERLQMIMIRSPHKVETQNESGSAKKLIPVQSPKITAPYRGGIGIPRTSDRIFEKETKMSPQPKQPPHTVTYLFGQSAEKEKHIEKEKRKSSDNDDLIDSILSKNKEYGAGVPDDLKKFVFKIIYDNVYKTEFKQILFEELWRLVVKKDDTKIPTKNDLKEVLKALDNQNKILYSSNEITMI